MTAPATLAALADRHGRAVAAAMIEVREIGELDDRSVGAVVQPMHAASATRARTLAELRTKIDIAERAIDLARDVPAFALAGAMVLLSAVPDLRALARGLSTPRPRRRAARGR